MYNVMPQVYQMVLVNIIFTLFTCVGIFIYNLLRRNKFNYLIVLIVISILPCINIFRNGVYESGDFNINIYKSISMSEEISHRNIPPDWAGNLNAKYGYPLFIFTYPLPYFLIVALHNIGFNYILSLKLFLAFTFIGSGLTMFYFLKSIIDDNAAFIGSIFYLFAPYHLVDLHFRVTIGELLSFAFIPLVFLYISKLITQSNYKNYFFLSICTCCLLLSHQAISYITIPFVFLWIVIQSVKQKIHMKNVYIILFAVLHGILIASFFWMPVIFLLQYTKQDLNTSILFPTIQNFLYSPWRYGLLFQGPYGELCFLLGYIQEILLLVSIYLVLRRHKYSSIFYYFLVNTFFLFLLMQSFSKPIWLLIPMLKNFQFSYRILVLITFFSASLFALLLKKSNNLLVIVICFLVGASTILNWGNRRMITNIEDNDLIRNVSLSTSNGEGLDPAMPKWVSKSWEKDIPKTHIDVVKGDANIREIYNSSHIHEYLINSPSTVVLKDNTWYFPGWKLFVNNRESTINYTSKSNPGIITFSVPKGISKVYLEFTPVLIIKIARLISIIAFSLLILVGLNSYRSRFSKVVDKFLSYIPKFDS